MNDNDKKSIKGAARENRRMILWLAAGAYLVYLAVELGLGVYHGSTAPGVQTTVAIVAAAVFLAVGLVLLLSAARMGFRSFKDSMAAMDELEAEESARQSALEHVEPPVEDELPRADGSGDFVE